MVLFPNGPKQFEIFAVNKNLVNKNYFYNFFIDNFLSLFLIFYLVLSIVDCLFVYEEHKKRNI